MERITPKEWHLISLALENHQLAVGDNIQLFKDTEQPEAAVNAEREYEALNRLQRKVAQRKRHAA